MECEACRRATGIVLRNDETGRVMPVCSDMCALECIGQPLPYDHDHVELALVGAQRADDHRTDEVLKYMRVLANYASRETGRALAAYASGKSKSKTTTPRTNRGRFEKVVRLALAQGGHALVTATQSGTEATLSTVSLGIPTEAIANVLFMAMNATAAVAATGKAINNLLAPLRGMFNARGALLNSFAQGGPAEVDRQMRALMTQMGSGAAAFAARVREMYTKVVDWTAPLVALLLEMALAVPGFGAVRAGVEAFLKMASLLVRNSPFALMVRLYNLLPAAGRELLESTEKLEKMVTGVINMLLRMFPLRTATKRQRMVAALKRGATSTALAAPFLILPVTTAPTVVALFLGNGAFASSARATDWVHRQIQRRLAPRVHSIAQICQSTMSLMFACLWIMEHGDATGAVPVALPAIPPRVKARPEPGAEAVPAALPAALPPIPPRVRAQLEPEAEAELEEANREEEAANLADVAVEETPSAVDSDSDTSDKSDTESQ